MDGRREGLDWIEKNGGGRRFVGLLFFWVIFGLVWYPSIYSWIKELKVGKRGEDKVR